MKYISRDVYGWSDWNMFHTASFPGRGLKIYGGEVRERHTRVAENGEVRGGELTSPHLGPQITPSARARHRRGTSNAGNEAGLYT